jgi:hypothetical protein
MSFDKFAWLKAVYADPRFPAGEKAVLAYVTVFGVLYGNDSFRVRQSTLADAAHSGISRQTVGSAIRRSKRHGYLAVVSPHAPGRTHHTAETLQLLLPAKSKASLHDWGGEPEETTPQAAKSKDALHNSGAESCKANGGNGVKQTPESCKAANSPTSENDTPNSSSYSSVEGSGAANDGERIDKPRNGSPTLTPRQEISIEPPKRACTRYPHSDACGTCGADKHAYQTWLADSRRLLADLDHERDAPGCPEQRATEISNERKARIAVFQRIAEPWK